MWGFFFPIVANHSCSASEFTCVNNAPPLRRCIPRAWVCDGDADCSDAYDEHQNCTRRPCLENEFTCSNGLCIRNTYRSVRIVWGCFFEYIRPVGAGRGGEPPRAREPTHCQLAFQGTTCGVVYVHSCQSACSQLGLCLSGDFNRQRPSLSLCPLHAPLGNLCFQP